MTRPVTLHWDKSPEAVARRLAEEEETATLMHQHLLASAYEHGMASGFAKSYLARVTASLDKEALCEAAYDAALAEAHRVVINEICQILGIMINVPTLERLNGLDLPQLV